MKKYVLQKMESRKAGRLPKRSIIGMRVSARLEDGLYYPGRIHSVKTPASPKDNQNCINLTPLTRYSVRFEAESDAQRRTITREFRDSELIGPGFRTITDIKLVPTQKVYITYNGRESSGDVVEHDVKLDEVTIRIHGNANEPSVELKKKLEEVRLLESRRSARLVYQNKDTDFARLADMAGDRRTRASSHSIDVPMQFTQHGSRKRRTSYTQDERDFMMESLQGDEQMDECNAALVLMSLSCSPNSPKSVFENYVYSAGDRMQTWSSGSSSPVLSDDSSSSSTGSHKLKVQNLNVHHVIQPNLHNFVKRGNRTNSLSTSDEGIVIDYNEDLPRKKKAKTYKCTWKNCDYSCYATTDQQVKMHVRNVHLGPKNDDDEDFYYTDLDEDEESISPPNYHDHTYTEDPLYQRPISVRHEAPSASKVSMGNATVMSAQHTSLQHQTMSYSQRSPTSPQKHIKLSPRPSTSYAPYNYSTVFVQQNNPQIAATMTTNVMSNSPKTQLSYSSPPRLPPPPQNQNQQQYNLNVTPTKTSPAKQTSPNRRARGENKKCRKVYGMDNRDSWCTQCKWKKACSRFGD